MSIQSSCILVSVEVRVPTGFTNDNSASGELAQQKQASASALRVVKKLFDTRRIQTAGQRIRAKHYSLALPWAPGVGIVKAQDFLQEYVPAMSKLIDAFHDEVDAFLNQYDQEVQRRRTSLGFLFNPDEYPSKESLRAKFGVRYRHYPVPDGSSWLLDVDEEHQRALQEALEEQNRRAQHELVAELKSRAAERITQLLTALQRSEDEGRKVNATVIENLLELVRQVQSFSDISQDLCELEAQLLLLLDGTALATAHNDAHSISKKQAHARALLSALSLSIGGE